MVADMCEHCQQVIEHLGIDIELFFRRLANLGRGQLSECDQEIICQSLLGHSRKDIALQLCLSAETVRDRLSRYIYSQVAELMQVDQEAIAGNWVLILNLLLNPRDSYKLNPAPQLNSDNFQGSFGRQIFLDPSNQAIAQAQTQGTQLFQKGLYYQSLHCFLKAWKTEQSDYKTGNPEVLIYISNCLLEWQKSRLQENDIKIYTLAVVIPFHHNQGLVALEILRGIAQIQLQINLQSLDFNYLRRQEFLSTIIPELFSSLTNVGNQIALRILIVNDPNKLYNPYNQTAESLANLALPLNLMAILGHYSSEMTKRALSFYSKKGLTLVNYSSTSNELSSLFEDEKLCFFRLTTQDSVSTKQLIHYLADISSVEKPRRVAIIYNKNSSYSTSYRTSIKKYLEQYSQQFLILSECDYLSEDYYQIREYLSAIHQQKVDIIIVITDGGIEPNSLNNTALISRLNLKNCLIAGSATFYQENVLHWMHEHRQDDSINPNQGQIIACIPWHWNSQINGCNSANIISQQFCRVGAQLWGEENLTWRSATAFDAVLIILRVLERYHNQTHQPLLNSHSLIELMDQYFKRQQSAEQGVTGTIKFDENGDRIEPPSEIVTVKWNAQQQKWQWSHLRSM